MSVGIVSVFAALHTVLYFLSFDLWRSWAIYLEPVEGIVLGPWMGFSAALIGSITARMIKPTDLWMFGIIAEPLGVLATGFLAKGRWKPVMAIYVTMLTAYFIHPLGRLLPLWTILDVLVAFVLVYPIAMLSKNLSKDVGRLPVSVPLSFVGTVTDALTRVFLLIPVGLYAFFGWTYSSVQGTFMAMAIYSYIEDVQVVLVSFAVITPLIFALRRIPGLNFPLS